MKCELSKFVVWIGANKWSLSIRVLGKHTICFFIDEVKSTKPLGVKLDENLSQSNHINMVRCKIYKSIEILCKAKEVSYQSASFTLYNAFAYPFMTYCLEIWGKSYHVNILQTFRKRLYTSYQILHNLLIINSC